MAAVAVGRAAVAAAAPAAEREPSAAAGPAERAAPAAAPLAAAAGASAESIPSCVRSDAQLHRFLNLDIRGEAFPSEHSFEWVYVVTKNASSGIVAAGRATVAGSFTLHLEGGYERNTVQQVAWFADADGSGDCYGVADHFGYTMVGPFDPAGNDAYSVTIWHDDVGGIPGETNPCVGVRPFGDMADIGVHATGFEAHEGATVYVLARNALNGFVFARGEYPYLSGQFGLHLPRAYARNAAEEIFWFVDADGAIASAPARIIGATP